jgi:hypothetical protein
VRLPCLHPHRSDAPLGGFSSNRIVACLSTSRCGGRLLDTQREHWKGRDILSVAASVLSRYLMFGYPEGLTSASV